MWHHKIITSMRRCAPDIRAVAVYRKTDRISLCFSVQLYPVSQGPMPKGQGTTDSSNIFPPPPLINEYPASHLAEVSDDVAAVAVHVRHDVEEERFHVEVQSLVVQEQHGQQTQVLAVDLVLLAVHLQGNKEEYNGDNTQKHK